MNAHDRTTLRRMRQFFEILAEGDVDLAFKEPLSPQAALLALGAVEGEIERLQQERDDFDKALDALKSAVLLAVPSLPDDIDWGGAERILTAEIARLRK